MSKSFYSRAARLLYAPLMPVAVTVLLVNLGVVSFTVSAAVAATSTTSDNCTHEQTIWSANTSTSAQYGTQEFVYIRDRVLDSQCGSSNPYLFAWSMVDLSCSTGCGNAETGFREYFGSTGNHVFYWYTCWQIDNSESCYQSPIVPNLTAGQFPEFKMADWPIGSNDIESWINFGSGYIANCPGLCSPTMPYNSGTAKGETGRYGDNTGMLDHHKGLQFKDSDNEWFNWTGQTDQNPPPNVDNNAYYWHRMSNTEYEICETGGTCPWQ